MFQVERGKGLFDHLIIQSVRPFLASPPDLRGHSRSTSDVAACISLLLLRSKERMRRREKQASLNARRRTDLKRREECRHHHPSGKRVNGRASEHAKRRAEEGNKQSGPEPLPQPQVNMATWRNRKRARPRPPYPQEIRNRQHNLIQTEEKHEINLKKRK